MTKDFDKPTAKLLRGALVHKLIGVADNVRNLATRFGARPYEVRLVHTRWSGGRRGSGVEEVVSEVVISPTPVVRGIAGMVEDLTAVGLQEGGEGVVVKQISPRYTREELLGQGPNGEPVGQDESFWWEVTYHHPSAPSALKRRFTAAGVPEYDPTGFAWSVGLVRHTKDRDRAGRTMH